MRQISGFEVSFYVLAGKHIMAVHMNFLVVLVKSLKHSCERIDIGGTATACTVRGTATGSPKTEEMPDKNRFTKCGRSFEIASEVRIWIKT